MKIHIRTKKLRWWSYVESAVVQIGEDTLEVMGGEKESRYWVNGERGPKLIVSGVQPFTIGGHAVRFRVLSDTQYQFKIFLENGQTIILRSVKDFMKTELYGHTKESFGTSQGILGSYEGGLMLGRDGVTVLEDPNAFAMEWQVRHNEPMLFHDVEGPQHPIACAMPSTTQRRRLGEQKINGEARAKASKHVDHDSVRDCIFDVMATDDLDMASAY